jgi:RNA polymerase sigma-70 factor (ECF subfamily)
MVTPQPSADPPGAPPGELDEITLARAQKGERAAWAALVAHHQGAVFALVSRILGRRRLNTAYQDLAQETFLRVFRALPTFDRGGPARLSTWILTIATRTTLNALRAGQRSDRLVAEASAHAGLVATTTARAGEGGSGAISGRGGPAGRDVAPDDPERAAADRQLGRQVEAAIAAMPEELRAVLILRGYHDFDYPEIAAALGLELGTVKSRLGRARAELRAALAGAIGGAEPPLAARRAGAEHPQEDGSDPRR